MYSPEQNSKNYSIHDFFTRYEYKTINRIIICGGRGITVNKFRRIIERIIFGGKFREGVLLFLLSKYYQSLFRRQWYWTDTEMHHENQRIFSFDFAFSKPPRFTGPYPFFRGFYCSDVIKKGDSVLDIGCGDGFFSMRFISPLAKVVDAVDVDVDAINLAKNENAAPNVHYYALDAITSPFPREKYNVIVWDGAIGHFSKKSCNIFLEKISNHLESQGIFVGSESIGTGGHETINTEGHDHLHHFKTKEELAKILQSHFKYVLIKEMQYPLSWAGGFLRTEAYWRCTNDPLRLDEIAWIDYSSP